MTWVLIWLISLAVPIITLLIAFYIWVGIKLLWLAGEDTIEHLGDVEE